jgi:hypothetical protein
MLQHELWRRTGLLPDGDRSADAKGRCACDPRSTVGLYRNSFRELKCAVCTGLQQAYPNALGGKTRLQPGHYILIEPRTVTYWGSYPLSQRNPAIQIQPKSDVLTMAEVFRGLILKPPETPWLFYAFSRDNRAGTLRVTEDNSRTRFGGNFKLFKRPVVAIDRAMVLDLLECGLTPREWQAYFSEFEMNQSFKARRELAMKHPKLSRLRFIPMIDSPEYLALSFIGRENYDKCTALTSTGAAERLR